MGELLFFRIPVMDEAGCETRIQVRPIGDTLALVESQGATPIAIEEDAAGFRLATAHGTYVVAAAVLNHVQKT